MRDPNILPCIQCSFPRWSYIWEIFSWAYLKLCDYLLLVMCPFVPYFSDLFEPSLNVRCFLIKVVYFLSLIYYLLFLLYCHSFEMYYSKCTSGSRWIGRYVINRHHRTFCRLLTFISTSGLNMEGTTSLLSVISAW